MRISFIQGNLDEIKQEYSSKTLDEMLLLLPNRNRNTIISKAGSLNLVNKVKLDCQFSDEEKSFIVLINEKAKDIKYEQGFNKPAPRDFVGFGPLTAPESVAIYSFILKHNFKLMLTYHTQGRVIFYEFQGNEPPESKEIVELFAKTSGYTPESTPFNSSFAGLKDWYILYYKRPGFTIEAGIGNNPLPISQFDSIYRENLGILINGLLQ